MYHVKLIFITPFTLIFSYFIFKIKTFEEHKTPEKNDENTVFYFYISK